MTTTLLSPESNWILSTGKDVPIPTLSVVVSAVNNVPPIPTSKLLFTNRSLAIEALPLTSIFKELSLVKSVGVVIPIPKIPSWVKTKDVLPTPTWNFWTGVAVNIPTLSVPVSILNASPLLPKENLVGSVEDDVNIPIFLVLVSILSAVPPTPTSSLVLTSKKFTSRVSFISTSLSKVAFPTKLEVPDTLKFPLIETSFEKVALPPTVKSDNKFKSPTRFSIYALFQTYKFSNNESLLLVNTGLGGAGIGILDYGYTNSCCFSSSC